MSLIRLIGGSVGGATRASTQAAVLLALLGGATTAAARGAEVSVSSRGGRFEVRGEFSTAAPIALAWEVLTDYEGIPSFVASVHKSIVDQRSNGDVKLRQVASLGGFPFRRTAWVTLSVHEEPQDRIEFADVLGRDFRRYAGSWSLSADSGATRVRYALEVTPRSGVPGWLGRNMMSHAAADLLDDVRAEIERRLERR